MAYLWVMPCRYKVSALEIERVLLEHDGVLEAAVVGVDDVEFGQRVGAVLVAPAWEDEEAALRGLREFGERRLAAYKLPTRCRLVDAIPKNAVGKVNKKELGRMFSN